MVKDRTNILVLALPLLLMPLTASAQHLWQQPLPPRSLAAVNEIMGPGAQSKPGRPLHIVWVWSNHDHGPGFHEYEKVRDQFKTLLEKVSNVTVDTAYKFPSTEQWKAASLVVFYLHFDNLKSEQHQAMQSFVNQGGGIIALHESMIMRPEGEQLAECLGLAWNEGTSLWGLLPTPFQIVDDQHPIFSGFGGEMQLVDEFYWKLTGDPKKIHILATSQGGPPNGSSGPAAPAELDGKQWPLFWTRDIGNGRVFASLPGHNLFTFDDAYYRIILFRAIAWTTRESFDPFKPLVIDGIRLAP